MIVLYEIVRCVLVLGLAAWLLCRARAMPDRPRLYALAGAVACRFLGDAYWLAHLIVRGETPVIFSACDVAYVGCWLMCNAALPGAPLRALRKRPLAAGMGALALLNGAAWIAWTGEWITNILWNIPLLLMAVRGAMLVEGALTRRQRGALLATMALLAAAGALWLGRTGGAPGALGLICSALWLALIVQLGAALRGRGSLRTLSVPAWLLLATLCEFASLLAQGAAYYGFQVMTTAAFAFAALAACGGEEARDAL